MKIRDKYDFFYFTQEKGGLKEGAGVTQNLILQIQYVASSYVYDFCYFC